MHNGPEIPQKASSCL